MPIIAPPIQLPEAPLCVRCDAPSDFDVWTAFTGRQPDFVHAFALAYAGTGWSVNVDTWDACYGAVLSTCATWAGYKLTWAMPLCTNTQNLAATTAGTYDNVINAMLDAMVAQNPVGPIYLRPGWEAGSPTAWPWSATWNSAGIAAAYVAAFQHVATLIRARSSRFVIEWCQMNYCYDYNLTTIDPTVALYPGDAYCDLISVDAYNNYTDIGHNRGWENLANGRNALWALGYPYGTTYLATFARAHGKAMSIPEWAVGADNPGYIRDMAAFIADKKNRVQYHGYWNKNASAAFPCRLTSDGGNNYVLSQAALLAHFDGNGTPVTEQSETSSFCARAIIQPVMSRRASYDRMFANLKKYGLLEGVEGIYVLAGADGDITLNGLNVPGTGIAALSTTTLRLTANGSPTFVQDRGYDFNGSTDYFGTGANPTTMSAPASQLTQNAGHMGLWSLTATANGAGQGFDCGSGNSYIGMNTGLAWIGRPNTSGAVSLTNTGVGPGHVIWNRTASNAWASYFNGAAAKTGSDASVALTNSQLFIGSNTTSQHGKNRLSIVHWGGALDVNTNKNDPLNLYNTFQSFLRDLGAA